MMGFQDFRDIYEREMIMIFEMIIDDSVNDNIYLYDK